MAFVLEPSRPLDAWLVEVADWLLRSPGFFNERPVLLSVRESVETREELKDLVAGLSRQGVRVMGLEGAKAEWLGEDLPPPIAGGRGASMIEVLPRAKAEPEKVEAPKAEDAKADAVVPVGDVTPHLIPLPVAPKAEAAKPQPARAAKASAKAAAPEPAQPAAAPATTVAPISVAGLIVDHPIRSGQTIVHNGDITIVGSVASGAEIVATGSIHVYGHLRGRAVAGSAGNTGARIFARHFEAELVAIAGFFRTAEDLGVEMRGRMAQISVEGDGLKTQMMN
jgi:septum site-determining protein MinC